MRDATPVDCKMSNKGGCSSPNLCKAKQECARALIMAEDAVERRQGAYFNVDGSPLVDKMAGSGDLANPKDIAGASKPKMGLIPMSAMESLARVMELGAKKYGPYNWRATPIKNMVYANAALRHLSAWIAGQSIDPESGQSHLAHVASCMMIVLDAEASGTCIEDREWMVIDRA